MLGCKFILTISMWMIYTIYIWYRHFVKYLLMKLTLNCFLKQLMWMWLLICSKMQQMTFICSNKWIIDVQKMIFICLVMIFMFSKQLFSKWFLYSVNNFYIEQEIYLLKFMFSNMRFIFNNVRFSFNDPPRHKFRTIHNHTN